MALNKSGMATRDSIIQACKSFFYEKGYEDTTFQDIGRATGIAPSTIAYHFHSKETLYYLVANSMNERKEKSLREYLSHFPEKEIDPAFICTSPNNFQPQSEEYYEMYLHDYQPLIVLDKSDKDYWLNLIKCFSADNGLYRVIFQNFEKYQQRFTFRDLARNTIQIPTLFFPYDKKLFDNHLEAVDAFSRQMKWEDFETTL